MTQFVIQCPWCRQKSTFPGDLAKLSITRAELSPHINAALDSIEKSGRLFLCRNSDCWAPFEALVCEGVEVAKELVAALAGNAWFPPRRFRLRKDESGLLLHENHFGVLFNRKPLQRQTEIRLCKLVDVDMVAKFLLGVTGDRVHPVTLFEGWSVGEEIFWLPVEALPSDHRPGSSGLPRFRRTCIACRQAFDAQTAAHFHAEAKLRDQCPHYASCPAKRACEQEDWEQHRISDRCLVWQQYRKKHDPCYSSDVSIIQEAVQGFTNRTIAEARPLKRDCWVGYQEVAFPLSVHDHLVAVVMTGQFPSPQAPRRAEEFLEREKRWRSQHAEMASVPQLPGHEAPLSDAIKQSQDRGTMADASAHCADDDNTSGIAESLEKALAGDVKQLMAVVDDRYLHRRYLSESAFRQEIAGTMTNALLGGRNMRDVLPVVLNRMREYWAFQHVCCLMGADWEEHAAIYATDSGSLQDDPLPRVQHQIKAESGARGIHLVPKTQAAVSEELGGWLNFLLDVGKNCPHLEVGRFEQFFIVIAPTARRVYVFIFYGRDNKNVSHLPFRSWLKDAAGNPLPSARLSDECREQVMRTCQVLSERLHHFWSEHDQEQAYRVLSHSLRSPIAQMQRGSGKVRFRLRTVGASIQNAHPEFHADLHQLLESLRLGSKIVEGELIKLGAMGNLAEILKKASSGESDLCEILRSVQAEYVWRGSSKVAAQRQVSWRFAVPNSPSPVVGDREVVEIVVRNVIDNAFKYSYGGREVVASVKDGGSCFKLRVTSCGVPVGPGEEDRVWDKNYRGQYALKRAVKGEEGTGFGLYLVKLIVHAAGGEATLSCRMLAGTPRPEGEVTVEISLPKSSPSNQPDYYDIAVC